MQEPGSRPRRIIRRIACIGAVLTVFLATMIAAAWWAARPAEPDAFYTASLSPGQVPGTLVRLEPFTKRLPAGTRGWRLLYVTTRIDGSPALASAVVFAPEKPTAMPSPVIAWAHGTTGIARGCAPSVMGDPFANIPAVDRIAGEGWVYVAADYVGLGTAGEHAYLVGDDAARAVLDAVRAARAIPGLAIDRRVVVWGHSQGGNTALWTGMRARAYAPEIELVGVAAQAPASDLKALVRTGQSSMFGKIVSAYLARAYAETYPDVAVGNYLRPVARLLAEDIASRCVGDRATLFSVAETFLLPREGIFLKDPTDGPLGARLAGNTPHEPIPAPVFIAQGSRDDLVLPEIQRLYVSERCAGGQPLLYRIYDGLDHVSLVGKNSPLAEDLVAWTRERFAGRPVENSCVG